MQVQAEQPPHGRAATASALSPAVAFTDTGDVASAGTLTEPSVQADYANRQMPARTPWKFTECFLRSCVDTSKMQIPHPPFCPLFFPAYIHRQASGDVAEWSKALPC
mgnify:CR=1 FL=1